MPNIHTHDDDRDEGKDRNNNSRREEQEEEEIEEKIHNDDNIEQHEVVDDDVVDDEDEDGYNEYRSRTTKRGKWSNYNKNNKETNKETDGDDEDEIRNNKNNNYNDDDHEDEEECDEVISLAEKQPPCSYYDDQNHHQQQQQQQKDYQNNPSLENNVQIPNMIQPQQQSFIPTNMAFQQQQQQQHPQMMNFMNFQQNSMLGMNMNLNMQQNQFSFHHNQQQQQQQSPQPQPQYFPFMNQIPPFYHQSPTVPPVPPPQLPLPIQMSIPMSPTFANHGKQKHHQHQQPNGNDNQLNTTSSITTPATVTATGSSTSSSLFQEVQYYESKMRDHAAAYASAAAGAAWAAAQIASGATPVTSMALQHQQQRQQRQQHQQHQQKQRHHQNQIINGNLSKKKKMTRKQKRSNHLPETHHQLGEKKIGGRGSGAPSTFLTNKGGPQQHSSFFGSAFHSQNKRSRPRREYNPQNQHHHHYHHHQKFSKKKRTLGLETLFGKNAVTALFELCSKQNWPSPKFVSLTSTNHSVSTTTICDGPSKMKKKGIPDLSKDHDQKSTTHAIPSTESQNDEGGTNVKKSKSATTTTSGGGYISSSSTPTNSVSTSCIDFVTVVQVNGQDLGKGRGGSKKSAQQDAARKAISVLYPGVVFDANGVLLDLGSYEESEDHEDDDIHGTGGLDEEYCNLNIGSKDDNRDREVKLSKTVVEDLETNLASRLAIDGEERVEGGGNHNVQDEEGRNGRGSPTPSEDSSISTTVSMAKNIVTPLMTGGPFKRNSGSVGSGGKVKNRSSIYPCASGTSVSSATSDDDDDEYYASRGAHVCSVLLHAMAQIDERIREPPSYTYDLCPKTTTPQNTDYKQNSSKRKGGAGDGVIIASKRQSTTNEAGRVVTIHRCSFACTASLTLYKKQKISNRGDSNNIVPSSDLCTQDSCVPTKIEEIKKDIDQRNNQDEKEVKKTPKDFDIDEKNQDENEAKKIPKDLVKDEQNKHDKSRVTEESTEKELEALSGEAIGRKSDKSLEKKNVERNEVNRKSEDSIKGVENVDKNTKLSAEVNVVDGSRDVDATEKLQAVATGPSKRDAKHTASAKLLALLFPDCEGMVAVVKAAEAAREKYAAKKALKQSMKATHFDNTKRKKLKCTVGLEKDDDVKHTVDDVETLDLNRDNYNISKSHLQSVKEEECEEKEGQESICTPDKFCHKRLKLK